MPISVNFLGVLTVDDVTERIERAYARQLDGRLKRWYTGFVRTLHPTVSAAPGGVGISVSPQAQTGALLERLEQIESPMWLRLTCVAWGGGECRLVAWLARPVLRRV